MKQISLAKKRELMMVEGINVSRAMSEGLKHAVFNPSKAVGANKIAMDLEGHVYFLFEDKAQAKKVKSELKKLIASDESIVADVEVEDFHLAHGVKVKVKALDNVKLVYRLESNPLGFKVENVKVA